MKRLLSWSFALFAVTFLLTTGALAAPRPAGAGPATAVFAGGCFWCMETDMKGVAGVVSVESGYTGGAMRNPSYRDVLTERTGHYEAVRVRYDPARISYEALLERYWKLVDPTDAGGQFCDRGPSYRTAVFVSGPEQRRIAEQSRARAAGRLKTGKMTTPVLNLGEFWPAEEHHRDYAKRNPLNYAAYRAGCGRDRRLVQVWGRG
jgi:peptide-methionine (S)-S-oxide reductase